jgi:hypothetical protein
MAASKRLVDELRERAQSNGAVRHPGDEYLEAQRGDAWEPPPDGYAGDHILGGQPRSPYDWQPYPVEALPEPAHGYVTAAAAAIGCDPSYVALPLLAGLASAIGASCRIRLKRGWSEPAILWTVIIGESGSLKSPAAEAPLRPIISRQAEAMRRYRAALEQYEHLCESASRSERPGRPVCARYLCGDITVEALVDRLAEAPRGLLLYREELAGWLRSYDAYRGGRGGDLAHWLSIFAQRPLMMDRRSADKTTRYVPYPTVSIVGGVTPGVLRACLGHEHFEDGLAARLLMAMPPARPKRWTEYDVTPECLTALVQVYDALYGLDLSVDAQTDEASPLDIPIGPAAKVLWVAYFDQHAGELAELSGNLAAAWSKLEAYTARIALLFHCVRLVTGQTNPGAIDEESMAGAIQLSRWHGRETRRIYAQLQESAEQRERQQLVQLIRKRGGQITVRQLMHASRRYRESSDAAEQALEGLVKHGTALRKDLPAKEQGGRPTAIYKLV